jgi:hypothetical protein
MLNDFMLGTRVWRVMTTLTMLSFPEGGCTELLKGVSDVSPGMNLPFSQTPADEVRKTRLWL